MSTDKRTCTVYVQILPVDPPGDRTLRVDGWHPWINSTSLHETVQLAAHKWFREAGYLMQGSEPEFVTIDVFAFDEFAPRHPNGAPFKVNKITLTLNRKAA